MIFTKMQGLGNDYVYIYGLGDRVKDIGKLACQVSDRHFGIGSDGLILIDPSEKGDFKMRMYNADGSSSPMCGNGVRCVGKYVYDKGHTDKTKLVIETDDGLKQLQLITEQGKVKKVRVNMGRPVLTPARIPVDYKGEKVIDLPFEIAGAQYRITCVSMGNPHVILFVDEVDRVELESLGPQLECHPFFPLRTNVEIVQIVSPQVLKMRVWERGTGETLACGTGACASLVAGVLNKRCDSAATLQLLGGELQVEWRADGQVYMEGGAETVFEGEIML